jgi:hypothetical protein
MSDEHGRSVFIVGWGRPGRADWQAVLVLAHEADEACALVADAYPERLRPQHALPASDATARAVISGLDDPTIGNLPVLR